jgi:hypothetical protein
MTQIIPAQRRSTEIYHQISQSIFNSHDSSSFMLADVQLLDKTKFITTNYTTELNI